jgi:hypothetical protein|tara:strand:+ start:4046 stop:5413 length:1368 start_codon:yes stop_codon:yes gene_type:complete
MAPLGIQIGVTTGSGINRPLSSFSGILDTYTDAVSGYSVRKLLSSATKSMKVRRSSDSNYQDIGFDSDGNLDTTTLLSFINTEKDIFTSDFPNGTSAGSGDGELGTTRTSLTAPSSIGGQTDALKITCDGSTQHYDMRVKFMENGQKHNVSFEYYIPSGNSVVGGIRLEDFTGSVKTFTTADAWTSVTLTDEVADNTILRFFAANSSGSKNIGSGVTESFYIRNLSVSQTTADGTVNILYDQTGNNDLSNGSASQQPKIVEAGSVVTKGGHPAIKFNNAEYLQKESASTSWVSDTNVSIFSVFSCVDFQHSSEATKDTLYNISGDEVSSGDGSTLGAAARNNQLRIGFFNQSLGGYGDKKGLNAPPNDTQILVSSIYDSSSTLTTILNASTNGTVTNNPEFQRDANKYTLGANHAGAKALDGTIQELIIWNEDQTDNRGNTDGIAGDINTYFDIY